MSLHINACIYSCPHAHTNMHTCSHMHTRIHVPACTHMHTHNTNICTVYVHAHIHACTYTHAHTKHIHTCTQLTQAHVHACTNTYTHNTHILNKLHIQMQNCTVRYAYTIIHIIAEVVACTLCYIEYSCECIYTDRIKKKLLIVPPTSIHMHTNTHTHHPSISCIHFFSEVVQAKFTYQVNLIPVSCCRTLCGCAGPGGNKSGCNGGIVPVGVGYVLAFVVSHTCLTECHEVTPRVVT